MTLPDASTDFDVTAALTATFDAWLDCFTKLAKIRETQAPGPDAMSIDSR